MDEGAQVIEDDLGTRYGEQPLKGLLAFMGKKPLKGLLALLGAQVIEDDLGAILIRSPKPL